MPGIDAPTPRHGARSAILCTQIDRVGGGLLLLGPDRDGAFTPAAMWPDASRDLQYLSPAAEKTLAERRGVVLAPDGSAAPVREQGAIIGYPIEVSGVLHGAVVLDVAAGPEQGLQRALRQLHWASAWLVDRFRQRTLEEREARLGRLGLAMDAVATALQEDRLVSSALAVANELATRLHCDRVSIGFEKSGRVEVNAISNTASFDPKMSLVRLIGDAMDEVLDLDAALVHPPQADDTAGAVAHAELAREFKAGAICSVPLLKDGYAFGALTFERGPGAVFDTETVALCRTIGELVGPVLWLKRDNQRGLLRRAADTAHDALRVLFGPHHPGAKLVAALVVPLGVFLSLATGPYRIAARTVIEGAVQRAAVAPYDGHIAESLVRAGDTVRKGQLLARLDDRDLILERDRLASEREQLLLKQRQALAAQDRSAMMILAAQIEGAEAQLALVNDKLDRASLKAPFDGVVVSGDLSQLLGTPVERGKALFQIAPLDAYRVILQVDEREIADVATGQKGRLILSGLPNDGMPFTVQQITPVATAEDGRNYFRVEARLQQPSSRLRPGMEGVGKITVGQRRLLWIWTHNLVAWMQAWAWKELP